MQLLCVEKTELICRARSLGTGQEWSHQALGASKPSRKLLETWTRQGKLSSGHPRQERPASVVRKAGGSQGPLTPIPPRAHLGAELQGPWQLLEPALDQDPELLLLLQDRTGLATGSGPGSMSQPLPTSFRGRIMPSAQSHLCLCTGDSVRCLLI